MGFAQDSEAQFLRLIKTVIVIGLDTELKFYIIEMTQTSTQLKMPELQNESANSRH